MKRVATAVVLIPLVLLIVFRGPDWLLSAVLGLVALLATWEYLGIVKGHGLEPFQGATVLAIVAMFIPLPAKIFLPPVVLLPIRSVLAGLVVWFPFFLMMLALRRENLKSVLPGVATSGLALIYIALPLILLGEMRAFYQGPLWIFTLLVIVWSGDIFGYYVGKSVGRHPMAPNISPKKTWEGALASVVGATIVGAIVMTNFDGVATVAAHFKLLQPESVLYGTVTTESVPMLQAVLLAAVTNVAAQFGDLAESALKRGANLKDSGSILPGHGGVLDRIDALLFAVPVLWYYAAIQYYSRLSHSLK